MQLISDHFKEYLSRLVGNVPTDHPYGIVAAFDGPTELIAAARAVRAAGYRRFDTHAPFPIHGMERAMGLRRSNVPWVVLIGGLTGGSGALLFMGWVAGYDFPLVFSGKPTIALPAYIPITFELTVLLAAFGALFGMLLMNLLPMLYHPLFRHPGFARVTTDGFFLSIEARDERFDPAGARRLLESLGGRDITLLEP